MPRKTTVENLSITAAELNEQIRKAFIEPDEDVTSQVEFGAFDEFAMQIIRCLCGATFENWDHPISAFPETAHINACPVCGVELYFRNSVTVFQKAGANSKKGG